MQTRASFEHFLFPTNPGQPGKFAQGSGSIACSACDAGKYAERPGSTYCSSCADGIQDGFGPAFWSYSEATQCATCQATYYRDDSYNDDYKKKERESAPCFKCPDGTECNRVNQDLEDLPIKDGFFRFTPTSHFVYECPYADGCRGVAESGNTSNTSYQTFGNVLCAEGYHGPLCAVCSSGYGFTQDTSKCEKCGKSKIYWKTSGVAATVVVCLGVLGIGLWYGCRRRINDFSMWSTKNTLFVNLMSSQMTTIAVTIQTGLLINENHEAAGGDAPPPSYQNVMSLFDVLNLKIDLVPMGCFDPAFGYFGVLLLQTLSVLGIALVLTFLWRNIRIRAGCGSRTTTNLGDDDGRAKADEPEAELLDEPREDRPRPRAYVCRAFKRPCLWMTVQDMQTRQTMYARYGVTFVKLVLPVVSLEMAQAFQCKTYDYGHEKSQTYLTSDYTVNCEESKYAVIKTYAIVMTLILPVGMPILALVALYRLRYRKRAEINATRPDEEPYRALGGEESDEERKQGDSTTDTQEESPFAILWRDVKPKFWYMEVVDIIRRLLLTCVPIAFTSSDKGPAEVIALLFISFPFFVPFSFLMMVH